MRYIIKIKPLTMTEKELRELIKSQLGEILKEQEVKEAKSPWKQLKARWDLQDTIIDIEYELRTINYDLAALHRDMEEEAEPEGGPIADDYGRQIEELEKEYKTKRAEFKKLMAKLDKLEQS